MAKRYYFTRYDTADLTDTSVFQPFTPNSNHLIRTVRLWVIIMNNPTFTSLSLKLYSNDANSPGKLLQTSTNSPTKSEIITLANGAKEIFFTFPDISVKSTDTYHWVLNATGYTGDWANNKGVGWRKNFPDPVYATNLTITLPRLGAFPYAIYWVGKTL